MLKHTTIMFEDWGLSLDCIKYPLTVKSLLYGSITDEFGSLHPDQNVVPNDILIEINDTPVFQSAGQLIQFKREKAEIDRQRDNVFNLNPGAQGLGFRRGSARGSLKGVGFGGNAESA